MKGLRLLIFVLILLSLKLCSGEDAISRVRFLEAKTNKTDKGDEIYGSRNLPCPDATEILPCICSVDEDLNMDMDCSQVENEEELASAFSVHFPFPNFRKLSINGNQHLQVLHEDVFGEATFTQISIRNGVLERVQKYVFAGSYSTATEIRVDLNRISSFPFDEIGYFTKLITFSCTNNEIEVAPNLHSVSMKNLYLSFNYFGNIDSEIFQGLPQSQDIRLYSCGITEIKPGTFTRLPNLKYVDLDSNNLLHIPEGTIDLNGIAGSFADIRRNDIASVAVNAITGVMYRIYAHMNALTELEEEVWRPHLERQIKLYLGDNPLTCGCDIAWLILNQTLLSHVSADATCATGEYLTELDPTIYETMC